MYLETSKFFEPARPDGHSAELDRLMGEYIAQHTGNELGKHAIGVPFEMFTQWLDSGDPDFEHFIHGGPIEAAQSAEVLQFPQKPTLQVRTIAS